MVSKVVVASGVLMTVGSSVMIGGFALLIYAGAMNANKNSLSSMSEGVTIAFGGAIAILLGAGIAAMSVALLDETEKEKEAQQAKEAKQPSKEAKQAVQRDCRS